MLTDTAGQEEYRGLWAASNLQSDAFLLVYDITSANSLDALEYYMEMIDMEEDNRIDNGKIPPVKILAGNKCDLQGQRQIKAKDGLEWARQRKCGFMETSAREMVNIEETFARRSCGDLVWGYADHDQCWSDVLLKPDDWRPRERPAHNRIALLHYRRRNRTSRHHMHQTFQTRVPRSRVSGEGSGAGSPAMHVL